MMRFAILGCVLVSGCIGRESWPEWIPGSEPPIPPPPPPVVIRQAQPGSVLVLYATDDLAKNDLEYWALVASLQEWCNLRRVVFRHQEGVLDPVDAPTDAGIVEVSIKDALASFASRGIVLAIPGKNVMYVSYSPLDKVGPVAATYFGVDP